MSGRNSDQTHLVSQYGSSLGPPAQGSKWEWTLRSGLKERSQKISGKNRIYLLDRASRLIRHQMWNVHSFNQQLFLVCQILFPREQDKLSTLKALTFQGKRFTNYISMIVMRRKIKQGKEQKMGNWYQFRQSGQEFLNKSLFSKNSFKITHWKKNPLKKPYFVED